VALVYSTSIPVRPPSALHNIIDATGNTVAYEVREEIQESSLFQSQESDGRPHYNLYLMLKSFDPFSGEGEKAGLTTVVSASVNLRVNAPQFDPTRSFDLHLNSGVFACGGNRVDTCVRGIIAMLDDESQVAAYSLAKALMILEPHYRRAKRD
jgi:hypothetical protein